MHHKISVYLILIGLTLMQLTACGGGSGNPFVPDLGSSTWTVDSRSESFNTTAAFLYEDRTLEIESFNIVSGYPAGLLFVDNIDTVTVGTPVDAESVDFAWNMTDDGYENYSDENPPCQVTFSILDLKSNGRIKGSLTGTLYSDQDGDWIDETYTVTASFDCNIIS